MSITPRGMSIQEAYRNYRENKFIVNRKYQRKLVWDLSEKRSLVDSVMRDYPIPLILLAESNSGSYEIIDGMQRLNAIFSFIENHYDLNNKYFDTEEFSRAKQAAESGLFTPANREGGLFITPAQVADFLDYQLAVTIFPSGSTGKTTDVFGRINAGGRQLSLQEKRHAGMIDEFSMLVRKLASEIRGDDSREILPLSDMPEISIDSTRANMQYSLKAEEIFWCKQGIISTRQLKESEDEEIICDICSSIVFGEPIARSKDLFDQFYDPESQPYEDLRRALNTYGIERLHEEVKVTLSVLREIIDEYSTEPYTLRSVINPNSTNQIKTAFFSLFMAMHNILIVEELSPINSTGIVNALHNLQKDMKTTAKYSKVTDRVRNIDKTKGLIQKFFIKKNPPMLKHGAGLALDFENALRRSKIETSRYEYKQGFLTLDTSRNYDKNLEHKILETICGIANIGPDNDGYLFIGVADSQSDAERIANLDQCSVVKVDNKYVVGVEREFDKLSLNHDSYIQKILSFIRSSQLSDNLKHQIVSQIDYVNFKGKSVVRIRIPAQNSVSFLGERAYIREHSSTVEASGKKLIAVSNIFK